jgi:hypothetical protein
MGLVYILIKQIYNIMTRKKETREQIRYRKCIQLAIRPYHVHGISRYNLVNKLINTQSCVYCQNALSIDNFKVEIYNDDDYITNDNIGVVCRECKDIPGKTVYNPVGSLFTDRSERIYPNKKIKSDDELFRKRLINKLGTIDNILISGLMNKFKDHYECVKCGSIVNCYDFEIIIDEFIDVGTVELVCRNCL